MTEIMGVDKPFNCDVTGCGMRFTNEDHLTVHRKKHEMCLSLNSESNAKSNNLALFVDQTPTPTRFIRNCEEVGLFQDLQSVNPFEEHFRKAAESVKMGHPPLSGTLQVPQDGDILNTPSVLISELEDDASLSAPLNVLNNSGPVDKLSLVDDVATIGSKEVEMMKDGISNDHEKITVIETDRKESERTIPPDVETNILPFLSSSQPNDLAGVTSTQAAITASSSVTTLPLSNISNSNTTNLQSVPPTIISNSSMVQFILKFPDGSSIPVHVPSAQTTVDSSRTDTTSEKTISNVTRSTASMPSSKNISNVAKLKLRESLTQGSSGESRALRLVNEQLSSSMVSLQNSGCIQESINSPGSMSQNKRRFGSEDNDIKRQKFLERNRYLL
ncbi:Cyclic AMP-responsive element-binding protein 5, variant 2 [Chamberlinius hualienensis]